MATYPYSPLDPTKPSIRLLHVGKGRWTDDITCQLCESFADADAGVPYKALSYTWGGSQHKPESSVARVLVDGHEIGLTTNLYWALRHIRRPDQDVMLWVDAICIDQDNAREKGHQVKQMGSIFKGAEEVLIWLGLSNGDIESLLESISRVDQKATEALTTAGKEDWTECFRRFMRDWLESMSPEALSRPMQALAKLLRRPWFERVWILQETAYARTAQILCGPMSCPARAFALMPLLMGLRVDEHTQAVLDIMPRLRRKTWWSSSRQLHVLLNKFSGSQAYLARDNIYALLGMSEDACSPESIYPCYEKTDDEVLRDTVSFLLFGEVVDSSCSFPKFSLPDLRLPISNLAGLTLGWALGPENPQHPQSPDRVPSRNTAARLVHHMNSGRLNANDVILGLLGNDPRTELRRVVNRYFYPNNVIKIDLDSVEDNLLFAVDSSGYLPYTSEWQFSITQELETLEMLRIPVYSIKF